MEEPLDATGLPGGASRLLLREAMEEPLDATGLSGGDSRLLLREAMEEPLDATGLPGGDSRSLLREAMEEPLDATGLPGGASRSRLPNKEPNVARCHRLVRWRLTLAATQQRTQRRRMPPACPVETHARCYPTKNPTSQDAAGLSGGDSRSRLPNKEPNVAGCHRLVRWRLTLAATQQRTQRRKMPPACPVETHARGYPTKNPTSQDAAGLSGGGSRSLLNLSALKPLRRKQQA